jgi:predicted phage baseplate assembly protein
MSERSGCCEGVEILTPLQTVNRPGLDALAYRVGTHATFLESMKARLSSAELPALAALTTRETRDPAIALLDAFAVVADVLTFYSERIANEGYLHTARERRSIFEMARLVGYQPRPGVSASVTLAFRMEDGYEGEIPAGTRAQSVPNPGELPQPFETSDKLDAHATWNELRPRLGCPQSMEQIARDLRVYFKGTAANLSPNDRLLFDPGQSPLVFKVQSVEPDTEADRTLVTLQPPAAIQPGNSLEGAKGHLRAVLENAEASMPAQAGRDDTGLSTRFGAMLGDLTANLSPRLDSERLDDLVGDGENGGDALTYLQDSALRLQELQAATVEAGEQAPGGLASSLRDTLDSLGGAIEGLGAIRTLATGTEREAAGEVSPGGFPSVDSLVSTLGGPRATTLGGGLAVAQPHGPLDIAQAFGAPDGTDGAIPPPLGSTGSLYSLPDASITAFEAMHPGQGDVLSDALGNVASRPNPLKVYVLRVAASLFGHNAPRPEDIRREGPWTLNEWANVVTLDGSFSNILPGSWVVVEKPAETGDAAESRRSPFRNAGEPVVQTKIARAEAITGGSRADYGISSARSTEITLDHPWLDEDDNSFDVIRRTSVHAQAELLELAEVPLEEPTGGGWRLKPVRGRRIELDSPLTGLRPGRWLIVSGEREDLPGLVQSELVKLAAVEHTVDRALPGDRLLSTLVLAGDLARSYERKTVKVYANVASATHGETRNEVLGSGDLGKELQQFKLRQSPLTYIAATNPAGAAAALEVLVDSIRWHEAETLVNSKPTDRRYATRTNDADETTIAFGDGEHGARVPSGTENIEAVYRTGLGRAGNVEAGQISQLATRPLGLAGVTNPLPATGGADREPDDSARRNAPLAVMALDRLVSVPDYADFARTFAGIGKAEAKRFGRGPLVHLTVAGRDDVPIARDSDLYRNLLSALRSFGDPRQPVQVDVRELILMVVSARVRLLADYQWSAVEPEIRSTLLREFSFERRELGQDVVLSEVTSAIHRVDGVAYVDVETFGGVPEKRVDDVSKQYQSLTPEQIVADIQRLAAEARERGRPQERIDVGYAVPVDDYIRPAQLAFLAPGVPQTLNLMEISDERSG